MNALLNFGDKLNYHSNWEGEGNCVLCNKPLGENTLWVLTDCNNIIITEDQYNSGDNYATPVGATCARKLGKGVAANW